MNRIQVIITTLLIIAVVLSLVSLTVNLVFPEFKSANSETKENVNNGGMVNVVVEGSTVSNELT